MAAFVLANVRVLEPQAYAEYRRLTELSLSQYGGRFRARGGEVEVLEGDWTPERLVIIEFESMEQARRWYHSEEYTTARAIRLRTAESQLILVDGLA
ncbi:MAG: DUF1330 domain-containing protein [Chloroflexi bacterium]|nr:DUF1330 domain-containing protein [Chloroflexota bacterium]